MLTQLVPVVTPDCIKEAVLQPDVAGPISATGAMKQPDSITPNAVNNNNLLKIIESPQKLFLFYIFLEVKKR